MPALLLSIHTRKFLCWRLVIALLHNPNNSYRTYFHMHSHEKNYENWRRKSWTWKIWRSGKNCTLEKLMKSGKFCFLVQISNFSCVFVRKIPLPNNRVSGQRIHIIINSTHTWLMTVIFFWIRQNPIPGLLVEGGPRAGPGCRWPCFQVGALFIVFRLAQFFSSWKYQVGWG